MSYILDALKKSDQERKRGDIPNLQTVHIPVHAEQKTPRMLYGFIAVLLLALAFIIGLMISNNRSPGPEQGIEVSGAEKVPDMKSDMEPAISDTVEAPKDQTIQYQTPQQDTAAENKPLNETEHERVLIDTVNRSQKTESNGGQSDNDQSAVVSDNFMPMEKIADINNVPYLHELADYQQQSIPQMNFAGHVYSSTPSSRSVIINGYAMSEGDTIVQGLIVEQITSSGVVFRFHDALFRVDILQDWSFE